VAADVPVAPAPLTAPELALIDTQLQAAAVPFAVRGRIVQLLALYALPPARLEEPPCPAPQ